MSGFKSQYPELQAKLDRFAPITLEEMDAVKLMNRVDTKYLTTLDRLSELLDMAQDDYMVQQIGGESNLPYYTMYLDTADRQMYADHHRGKTDRKKVRIRRYDSTRLSFLEIKSKNNKGRTKKRRVTCNADEIGKYRDFIAEYTPYAPSTLQSCIENRFNRITLVNNSKTERLTIDTCLRFHNLCDGNCAMLADLVIIELKRSNSILSPATMMLNRLHIRPRGFSKYCIGMSITDPLLKQNRFKPKLRFLQRNVRILRGDEVWTLGVNTETAPQATNIAGK